jgi:RNA polymerase sigma factor (sigma-70 family)
MQQLADGRPSSNSAISEQTFADLLTPLIEPGFRLALGMLHDPSAAEDAVQEASFTAWRKLARIQDQDRLRPWFLGVVANKCRNARRRKWVADVRLGLPEQLSVVSDEERSLLGTDLRRAVARLRHEDRLVVVLYFYLDMPLEDLRPELAIQEALR